MSNNLIAHNQRSIGTCLNTRNRQCLQCFLPLLHTAAADVAVAATSILWVRYMCGHLGAYVIIISILCLPVDN